MSSSKMANQIDPTVVFGFTNLPDNRQREPLRIVRGKGVARLTNEVQFHYDRELQWEQNTVTSI